MKRSKNNKRGDIIAFFLSILKSPAVRLDISLAIGLLMNVFYIAVNLLPAVRYRSAWSLAVTLYYAVLVLMRVSLLGAHRLAHSVGDDAVRLSASCRLVGRLLLLLDAALAAVMVYTVSDGRIINYPTYIFIGFGIFTAYSVTASLVGIFRSIKNRAPHALAVRNLTLAAALLSVFNLEYTLLISLGVDMRLVTLVNLLLGSLSVALISVMAIRLILVSTRVIRDLRTARRT